MAGYAAVAAAAVAVLAASALASDPTAALAVVAPAFRPAEAAAGGLILAAAVIARMAATGRLLGVSGVVRGALSDAASPQSRLGSLSWRLAFVSGCIAGGRLLSWAAPLWGLPPAFESLPPTYTLVRACVGGALVGLGTAMGNGCTSGHGVCGVSRGSPRSMAATAVFMAAGVVVARWAGTGQALGLGAGEEYSEYSRGLENIPWAGLGAAACVAGLALAGGMWVASISESRKRTPADAAPGSGGECLAEGIFGFSFALGLGVAGMTRPSKVAAFLSVGQPWFDPSLAFVMGVALLAASLGFAALPRLRRRPILGGSYQLGVKGDAASAESITMGLATGAALFGAGWGVTGICPGPLLVNLGAPGADMRLWAFCGAMVAGMACHEMFSAARRPPPSTTPAGVPIVTVAAALALLESVNGSGRYLDIRDAHEAAAEGRVPGASLVPYLFVSPEDERSRSPNPGFLAGVQAAFPEPAAPLVVGCRVGNRSAAAVAALRLAGYSGAVSLQGGYAALTGSVGRPCG